MKNRFALFGKYRSLEKKDLIFLLVAALSLVFFVFITVFFMYFGSILFTSRLQRYQVGMIAEKDIVVNRDILYIDQTATNLKREAAEQLILPVYRVNNEIARRNLENYDRFISAFEYLQNRNDISPEQAFLELQTEMPGLLTQDIVTRLMEEELWQRLLVEGRLELESIYDFGILALSMGTEIPSDRISVWRTDGNLTQRDEIELGSVITMDNIHSTLMMRFSSTLNREKQVELITDIVYRFADENGFYDSEQTDAIRERNLQRLDPVVARLVEGEVLVKRGFIITSDNMEMIRILGNYGITTNLFQIISSLFFFGILLYLGIRLLKPPVLPVGLTVIQRYLVLGTVVIFGVFVTGFSQLSDLPGWLNFASLIPAVFLTMVITIFVHHRAGMVLSTLFSVLIFYISGFDTGSFFLTFFTSLFGVIFVQSASKRVDLMRAALRLSLVNFVISLTVGLFSRYTPLEILYLTSVQMLNTVVSSVLLIGTLPFLEHLLNSSTPFRLMELSDLNTSMFKRMITLAPGTYGHSVNVANLAESACQEIGANGLLARVGAYYHDIGKIDQAEYYIENQLDVNKHDDLKPSLSVAVIKSHLKVGVEKGKDLKLPKAVIDIIGQHHGNSVITYFYNQALKEGGDDVNIEDFTYAGIPPETAEAAVVLLADSVEAATRTLKNPSLERLDKFIGEIIMDKIQAGQMDNCPLTFSDLKVIKQTFVRILAGQFHQRIEYPKMKKGR